MLMIRLFLGIAFAWILWQIIMELFDSSSFDSFTNEDDED